MSHQRSSDTGAYEIALGSWLSEHTLGIIDQKRDARLQGNVAEHRRLKGVYKAKAKNDLEEFYNKLAGEAEDGLVRNNLLPTYRAIKTMQGGPQKEARTSFISRADGTPCRTTEEMLPRWREHYDTMLNHGAATPCADLDIESSTAIPAPDIASDAPALEEVRLAIRKLKNGRAAGFDRICPELLKCAEESVSNALHVLFQRVWRSGRVPVEWKDGVSVSL